MVVAVTGASGFIGRRVIADLLGRGYEVRAVTRNPAVVAPGAEHFQTPSLDDARALRSAFQGANVVLHLAGHAHAMSSADRDGIYRAVNVEGSRSVAHAAAAESVDHLLFASSVKAIGEGGAVALNDATPAHPVDAYGKSKLEAENTLYAIGAQSRLPITVLRFPLVYGPGVKGNLRRLFDAVDRGIPLPVGGIRNERSMLGIDNLTEFLAKLLQLPAETRAPMLVSDSESVSTESLVRMIAATLGKPARVVNVPASLVRAMGKIGDLVGRIGVQIFSSGGADRLLGSLLVDSSRAWRLVGINPPVSLEEGLRRVAQWYTEIAR